MGPAVETVFALLPRQRIRRGHKCVRLGHTAAQISCPSIEKHRYRGGTVVAPPLVTGGGDMIYQPTSNRPLFVALATLVLLLGCASTPGAKPEDMSAKSHEEAAAKEAAKADQHAAKYDPAGTSAQSSGSDTAFEGADFNPTDVHNVQAETHREHANDHAAAAAALTSVEEDACKSIPSESRSWCPLLGPVAATENTPNGVRVTVRDGTDVDALIARVRCHLAFANTQGREGMDRCPLYVPGVQVERSGPNSIELSAKGKASIRELQERVTDHIGQ